MYYRARLDTSESIGDYILLVFSVFAIAFLLQYARYSMCLY